MKTLKWCKNAEDHAYMAKRKLENLERSLRSDSEAWMAGQLNATGLRWTRQAQWGHRLFDFWNAQLGIAVEVDGPEHDAAYDAFRDEYNFRRSGIVVLRVKNFSEDGAAGAVQRIKSETNWKQRKAGLKMDNWNVGIWLASLPYPPSYLERYLAGQYPFPEIPKSLYL